jgi:hypothetical protein
VGRQLQGALEQPHRRLMLALQAEAVASDAPAQQEQKESAARRITTSKH